MRPSPITSTGNLMAGDQRHRMVRTYSTTHVDVSGLGEEDQKPNVLENTKPRECNLSLTCLPHPMTGTT